MVNGTYQPEVSGFLYFTNYTVNASLSGYVANSTVVNITGSSSIAITLLTFTDSVPPIFTSNVTLYQSGTQYQKNRAYGFQTNVTDDISVNTTLFESNFDGALYNSTAICSGTLNSLCTINFTDIPAGSYQYRWIANDTIGAYNTTGIISYTVSKADTNITLLLNGTRGNVAYQKGDVANVTASLNTTFNITIFANYTTVGQTIANGTSPQTNLTNTSQLSGPYTIKANWSGDANYSSDEESWILTVQLLQQEEAYTTR
ncbi:MAG: hypothetical protein HZB68_00050 [Candidatus Aenigmarchaeota archaeon]|nr:hypothetical protein [Candidatus Aenigmarchaeota archaeon]